MKARLPVLIRILFLCIYALQASNARAQPGKIYTSLTEALKQPQNVYRLNLRKTSLTAIPKEIFGFTNLVELVLEKNKIGEVPDDIAKLSNLEILDLDQNQIKKVSPEIGKLTRLKELDLDRNGLSTLPDEFWNLVNLDSLDLHGNAFTSLPSGIGKLVNLKELKLEWNALTSLPSEIGRLTQLVKLNISKNKLSALPQEIGNLVNLQEFLLTENKLTSLPAGIGKLKQLKALSFFMNKLQSIPPEIGELTQLKSLNFYMNELASLPPEIGKLTNLTWLILENNALKTVPGIIGNLVKLEYLGLDHNYLTVLPKEIGNLKALTSLGLGENQFTSVPSVINSLVKLKTLWLSFNKITFIPDLGKLKDLEKLYLYGNPITYVHPSIAKLGNLVDLSISENALKILPIDIVKIEGLDFVDTEETTSHEVKKSISREDLLDLLIKYSPLDPVTKRQMRESAWLSRVVTELGGAGTGKKGREDELCEGLYFNLLHLASEEQLVRYSKDENPNVRVYALRALDERKYKNLFSIVRDHLLDSSEVNYYFPGGRSDGSEMAGDLFITAKHLTPKQRHTLDSLLIFTYNPLIYTDTVISRLKPEEKYHQRMRELAPTHTPALFLLAQYHDEADLQLIESCMLSGRTECQHAIELFPHPYFKKTLEALVQKGNGFVYFPALSIYRDDFSAKLLRECYNRNQPNLFFDIATHYDTIYNDLLFDICKKYTYYLADSLITHLHRADPKRCLELCEYVFSHPEKYFSKTNASACTSYIAKYDPMKLSEMLTEIVCTMNDSNSTYHYTNELEFYAGEAQKCRSEELTNCLLYQLRHTTYGPSYVAISKTILSYGNPEWNKILLSVLNEKKRMNDYYVEQVKLALQEKGLLDAIIQLDKQRQPQLQGAWQVQSIVMQGKVITAHGFLRLYFFKDTTFRFVSEGQHLGGRYFHSGPELSFDTLRFNPGYISGDGYYDGSSYDLDLSGPLTGRPHFPPPRDTAELRFEKLLVEKLRTVKGFSLMDSTLTLLGDGEIMLKLYDNWYGKWAKPIEPEVPQKEDVNWQDSARKLTNIPVSIAGLPLSWYLKQPGIDSTAKKYISGKMGIWYENEEIFPVIDSIFTEDPVKQKFYFYVFHRIMLQARKFPDFSTVGSHLAQACMAWFLHDPAAYFSQVRYGAYAMFSKDWEQNLSGMLMERGTDANTLKGIEFIVERLGPGYKSEWKRMQQHMQDYLDYLAQKYPEED